MEARSRVLSPKPPLGLLFSFLPYSAYGLVPQSSAFRLQSSGPAADRDYPAAKTVETVLLRTVLGRFELQNVLKRTKPGC